MSRKVKVSDVRQGVTLYTVHAFPHKKWDSFVDPIVVTRLPSNNKSVNSLFASQATYDDNGSWYSNVTFSLKDKGIIPNPYNFHKTFHTRKAAQRYADRMQRGCLTQAERERVLKLFSRDLMFREFEQGF